MATYKEFSDGDVTEVRGLCNALMAFQAKHATILPEVMGSMNFENRLLPEFQTIEDKTMVIAYVKDIPVGFGFATCTLLCEAELNQKPSWADSLSGQGFYPKGYLSRKIGTFKLLYVNPDFRGMKIGENICNKIMTWLNSKEADDLWVFVANGNEGVGKLYEKLGFNYSHSVYNGFIQAYRLKPNL